MATQDNGNAQADALAHESAQSPRAAQAEAVERGDKSAPTGRRHTPRVRTVRLTTQLHPDALVPFLYGERGGRSINRIVQATGCTVDYCALSPDEPERCPQTQAFVMNFLVSAATGEQLEEATRQLKKLVDRVQLHLQKKNRQRAFNARVEERKENQVDDEMSDGRQYFDAADRPALEVRGQFNAKRRTMMSPTAAAPAATEASVAAACSKRESLPEGERWETGHAAMEGQAWDVPAVPMMYYAGGGTRYRRQRPRYMEVADVDTDEKGDFVVTGNEAAYMQQQRSDPAAHFVPRRRVRRYPDPSRWPPRVYERAPAHFRNERGYAMYAAGSPKGSNDHDTRIPRFQQPRYLYPGAPNYFAHESAEYDPYEYVDEEGNDGRGDGGFDAYDAAVDLTNETANAADSTEFVDVQDHRSTVQQRTPPHPHRRSQKRPLSKMRSDMPPQPPIYRQRMPYIYDYAYAEEDDEWMADDEDMAMAFGYLLQYPHVDAPNVRRRRRIDSVSSVHHWGSPDGHVNRRMVKRRRIPHAELPLDTDMSGETVFETPDGRTIDPPIDNAQALHRSQLEEETAKSSVNMSLQNIGSIVVTEHAPVESDASTTASPDENQGDNAIVEDEAGSSFPTKKNYAEESPSEVLSEATAAEGSSDEILVEPSAASIQIEESLHSPSLVQERFTTDESRRTSGETSGMDNCEPFEITAQSGIAPLNLNASASVSSRESASSPISKTRYSSPQEEESRTASPPAAFGSDENASEPVDLSNDSVTSSPGRTECVQAASSVESVPVEESVQVLPTDAAVNVQENTAISKGKSISPSVAITPHVKSIVTDTIRINNHVIASLERMNKVESAFETAKASLTEQEEKFRGLENDSKARCRLEILCGVVCDLQCRIGSRLCDMKHTHKQDLLAKLDNYLENLLTSEQTLHEKVFTLQTSLEQVVSMDGPFEPSQSLSIKASTTKTNPVMIDKVSTPPDPAEENEHNDDEADAMHWEDDGWFEETMSTNPAMELEEQENFVAQISSRESNLKLEGEYLLVKLEEGASPRWPRQLPSFVWSLLARVISSDPQSYVMRVTHKRLMEEIAKGDPYYYLHPMATRKEDQNSSELSPSQPCEFGCRGGSALKWERKLVSQISSRMKSFDNVAYSLARSSGGKEVLNRKKMNSIIRKLHLVAMQLHSLISHLYCVKGQMTCKEVDSLPIALNNSHFERKMGVYKSRLKLVVPHKYQQQQQPQQQLSGSMEPAEELLRDTYEFFPELLICVDIWGYNYREGQAKQQTSSSLLVEEHVRPGSSGGNLFPLEFFRGVENHAFDFEHDGNSILRRICDELLNIVCLWNDFKWTDNLEGVALERVVAFETDVTASIINILELHAHHLQALWAIRLLDDPDRLQSVHFTQFNAYYSERTQGSLVPCSGPQSRASGVSKSPSSKASGSGLNCSSSTVDQLVAHEIIEQRLAEDYWKRKIAVLSAHDPIDDAMETDDVDQKASHFLTADTICSWDQPTLVSYLLRWSDVYGIRNDMSALSSVTSHMLKHEMQKYRIGSRASHDHGGGHTSGRMVDAATKQLLAAVSRAQMMIRDAVIPSEKLALHCASSQLPDEKKRPMGMETCPETEESSDAEESVLPSNENADTNSTNSAGEQVKATTSAANHSPSTESPDSVNGAGGFELEGSEAASKDRGIAPEQPELQDLIQLLAVTKQDMQELCSHRPRSARMREKLQTQSLQLARQTVEIFRNIRNMYGSQRR